MKISLSHLPEQKQEELKRVTRLIVETVQPEKIILFGSHATGTWVKDSYKEGHITYEYISDYDLLVVTKPDVKKKDHEITDQIKNRLYFRVPVNVITHDIDYVNDKLSTGQYFFKEIVEQGILLYDAGNTSFVASRELSAAERKAIAQQDFDKWFSTAKEFLEGTKFYLQRNELKIAVFQLHQATERTYNTSILVFTGYKPKTHNLDKLRAHLRNISLEVFTVFPNNTKEEEHLFSILQKGYLDARYNDNFSINREELQELIKRVEQLQTITEKVCKKKIKGI